MKKICAIFLLFVALTSVFSVNVGAAPVSKPIITSGNKICVLNLETMDTPMNMGGDVKIDVSATAKMMAALVVYENISDLTTLVTVPAEAANAQYIGAIGLISTPYLGLTVGEEYSVKTLLSALLISSANDAGVTLAYHVGNGDINAFVQKMNEKAKALGAKNTMYNSCVGLNDGSYTTAYDSALIAAEFVKNGTLLDISSAGKFVTSTTGASIHSKNYLTSDFLVRGYKLTSVKGICAGQSREDGGYCLLAYYTSNELSYIICVMDASGEKRANGTRWFDDENAYKDVWKIVPWLKESFEIRSIISPESSEYSFSIPVKLSAKVSSIMTVPTQTVKVLTDVTAEKINYVADPIFFQTVLEAPVKEGEVVGEVNLYKNGTLIATVPLVTKTGAERSEMLVVMGQAEDLVQSDTVKLIIKIIIILAILFAVWSFACFIFRIIKKYKNGMTKDYYPSAD